MLAFNLIFFLTALFAVLEFDTVYCKVARILVFWQSRSPSEAQNIKIKTPFWEMLYLSETKTGVTRILVIFQDRPMFSMPFKRSRRELSIHVAQHRSTLKIHQTTHYPSFSYIPKTSIAFP